MKNILKIVPAAIVVVILVVLFWEWGFCRFYIGPNEMAIITAKNGDPLEPGQILARDGQKGIREELGL